MRVVSRFEELPIRRLTYDEVECRSRNADHVATGRAVEGFAESFAASYSAGRISFHAAALCAHLCLNRTQALVRGCIRSRIAFTVLQARFTRSWKAFTVAPGEIHGFAERKHCLPGEIHAFTERMHCPPGEIHAFALRMNAFAERMNVFVVSVNGFAERVHAFGLRMNAILECACAGPALIRAPGSATAARGWSGQQGSCAGSVSGPVKAAAKPGMAAESSGAWVLAMPSSSLARTPLMVVWSCSARCPSMAM
jgi:hypothetical protein